MSAEQRRHPRRKCAVDTSFRNLDAGNTVSETVVRDISESGVRFRATHFIALHHKLLLKINIPKQKPVEAVVRPAWVREIPSLNQFDVGVEFISLSDSDREILRGFTQSLPFSS